MRSARPTRWSPTTRFTAPAHEDLDFRDGRFTIQGLKSMFGFCRFKNNLSARYGNTVLFQKLSCLVLVNFHELF